MKAYRKKCDGRNGEEHDIEKIYQRISPVFPPIFPCHVDYHLDYRPKCGSAERRAEERKHPCSEFHVVQAQCNEYYEPCGIEYKVEGADCRVIFVVCFAYAENFPYFQVDYSLSILFVSVKSNQTKNLPVSERFHFLALHESGTNHGSNRSKLFMSLRISQFGAF